MDSDRGRATLISLMRAHCGCLVSRVTKYLLCCVSVVVAQQTAKPRAALDLTIVLADSSTRLDDLVAQSLVISFAVIMSQKFSDSRAQ